MQYLSQGIVIIDDSAACQVNNVRDTGGGQLLQHPQ